MKVIIKDTGEVKEVSFGHAVNYLIPQGLVVRATPQALKALKKQQATSRKQQEEKKEGQEKLGEKLRGKIFSIEKKVGEDKKLFGSVTKQDILKILDVPKEMVEVFLDSPIKTLGKHNVILKIGNTKVKVKIAVKKQKE